MRDSFIFYRSFYESFDGLSKKDKLLLFDAVCNYALNGIEPELNGVPLSMFKLLKPQLDANNRRFENGKKGGRPKKTETKPNDNQTKTKTKPNNNVNVNVNGGNVNASGSQANSDTSLSPEDYFFFKDFVGGNS